MAIPITAFIRSGDTGINEAMTRLATYASGRPGVEIYVAGEYTLSAQRALTGLEKFRFYGPGKITLAAGGLTNAEYVLRLRGQEIYSEGVTWAVTGGNGLGSRQPALCIQTSFGGGGDLILVDASTVAATREYYLGAIRPQSGGSVYDIGGIRGVKIDGIRVSGYRSGGFACRNLEGAIVNNILAMSPNQASGSGNYRAPAFQASHYDGLSCNGMTFHKGSGSSWGTVFEFTPGAITDTDDLGLYGLRGQFADSPESDSDTLIVADAGTGSSYTYTYTGQMNTSTLDIDDFEFWFKSLTEGFADDDVVVDSIDLPNKQVVFVPAAGGNFANQSFAWYGTNIVNGFNKNLRLSNIHGEGTSSGSIVFVHGARNVVIDNITGKGDGDSVISVEWSEQCRVSNFLIDGGSGSIRNALSVHHFARDINIEDGTFIDCRLVSSFGHEPFLNWSVKGVSFIGANSGAVKYHNNNAEVWGDGWAFTDNEFVDGAVLGIESRYTGTATAPVIPPTNILVARNNCRNMTAPFCQYYGVDGLEIRDNVRVSGPSGVAMVKNRNTASTRPQSANVKILNNTTNGNDVYTEETATTGGDSPTTE